MTELPKKIIVNRIPYSVCNSNDPYSYEADPGVQEIRVTQEAAPARKRQYFMWEVAHLLLVSAGMPQKEADRYHAGVGSVLNRLVIDNDTDFMKGRKPVPSMIWINGLPYTIQQGIFKELQDEDLGGRVTYDTLYIQIMEDLSAYVEGIGDRVVALIELSDCKGRISRSDLDKAMGHVNIISGTVNRLYSVLANEPKEGKEVRLPKD